eukprot:Em0002g102a
MVKYARPVGTGRTRNKDKTNLCVPLSGSVYDQQLSKATKPHCSETCWLLKKRFFNKRLQRSLRKRPMDEGQQQDNGRQEHLKMSFTASRTPRWAKVFLVSLGRAQKIQQSKDTLLDDMEDHHHSSSEELMTMNVEDHHHSSSDKLMTMDVEDHHHSSSEEPMTMDVEDHHHSSSEELMTMDVEDHHHSSSEEPMTMDVEDHHHSSSEELMTYECGSLVD